MKITSNSSQLMKQAHAEQLARLARLAEDEDCHPERSSKRRTRMLSRVASCSELSSRSIFRCEAIRLCVPCAVVSEVRVAVKRLSAYAKIERLGYGRSFLVTITARHREGDDLFLHRRAVKAQTDAVLTSLAKRRVTIATDAASECEVKESGLHYHAHIIAWINPASELSDDEIRNIALTARHHAVGKLQPRTDGLTWLEVSSSDWMKPAYDVERLSKYFSKTVNALDSGSGGLFRLPAMAQYDIATLMAGERSMRFAGLLKRVSAEGYDASKVVMLDMSKQPTDSRPSIESRMLTERPIVQPLFEGAEESLFKVTWFSLDILHTLHSEGLIEVLKPRPAVELSRRVSAMIWPVHKSPLDQLRQLREECIRAGLVQDGRLTTKGALAIGLNSEPWKCAA